MFNYIYEIILTFVAKFLISLFVKIKIQKDMNVPPFDGIPGVMPGIISVPPPPEFEDENYKFAHLQGKNYHSRGLNNIPKHKRRMMSCNKNDKD